MGIISSKPKTKWTAEGRNILITGASSGIGEETARLFAKQGANLALIARSRENLERVADECRKLGSKNVKVFCVDLSDTANIEMGMKAAIEEFKSFDVVLLNAGQSQGCYFEEIRDPTQIKYMLDLNVNGIMTSLFYLLPSIFKSKHSRIVVTSSSAGLVGGPFRTIYSATKFALTGFCNSLRMELDQTYGDDAPSVCLLNIAEVKGTKLNKGRMKFGALQPPAEFDEAIAKPLEKACKELVETIVEGKRQWGEPPLVTLLQIFVILLPSVADFLTKRYMKKNMLRNGKRLNVQ